jgi:hypothetical protein
MKPKPTKLSDRSVGFGYPMVTLAAVRREETAIPRNPLATGNAVPCIRYLGGGQFSCRPDRELQHLAQGSQIGVPRTSPIALPEIYAGSADTDLLGNFCDAEAAAEASGANVMGEDRFTGHRESLLLVILKCVT